MTEMIESHVQILERGQKAIAGCSEYARLGIEINIDPQVLDSISKGEFQPIHHDLLVLCAAVEYADRRWAHHDFWSRQLHVTVPVSELALWQEPAVSDLLKHLLRYLTCDSWHFDFVQARETPQSNGQKKIIFDDEKTLAIAYSDGLDSRAVWALSGTYNESICIRVAKKYNKAKKGDSLFTQIPFAVTVPGGRESSFRSRSFQFAVLTAIAAHIAGFSRIVVPESGQGALSPAILPLHRIYADVRNYPLFFRKMERFINMVLKHKVLYEQSRLWSTKAETMEAFLKLPGKSPEYLIATRSCWQIRNVVNHNKRRRQCGLCAACILRRFSLHKANVVEPEGMYVVEDLTLPSAKAAMFAVKDKFVPSMIGYGIAAVRHFQQFADLATRPDRDLRVPIRELSAATDTAQDVVSFKFRTLLSNHANEWNTFIADQGRNSFLTNWIDGGS